jgi:hypothetical protein
MVYEANQGYDEESGGSVSSDLFFGTLSALDDIDGDGAIDFLTARPHNSQLVGPSLKGVVRAMRFRPGTPRFIRGDATANGRVDLADAVVIIQGLFTRSPPRCAIAHDADGDGTIELQDAAMILDYFFLSHRYEPSAPFPECGRYDMLHSHRRLGCADEGACSGG